MQITSPQINEDVIYLNNLAAHLGCSLRQIKEGKEFVLHYKQWNPFYNGWTCYCTIKETNIFVEACGMPKLVIEFCAHLEKKFGKEVKLTFKGNYHC